MLDKFNATWCGIEVKVIDRPRLYVFVGIYCDYIYRIVPIYSNSVCLFVFYCFIVTGTIRKLRTLVMKLNENAFLIVFMFKN